jgi:D-3-phosphoglycerate dehydrogenase
MTKYVYNIEPEDYSPKAIRKWEDAGYAYFRGSWEDIQFFEGRANVEILIVRLGGQVTSDVLNKFPKLKFVISATTGHNHLNQTEISNRGVKLISLRGHDEFLRGISSTAEFTWALLLNLLRKIPASITHVEDGNWNRDLFKGFQLSNKRIGIIGLGRIGSLVARYAQAFSMDVAYYDPYVFNPLYSRCSKLEDLVSSVDILSIHIHPDPSNHNLISEKIISLLKDGAYIINTARGEVWDEHAVVRGVLSGKIRGVGADVVTNETTDKRQSPIWQMRKHPNILLTPHLGGASFDAMWACEEYTQTLVLNELNGLG